MVARAHKTLIWERTRQGALDRPHPVGGNRGWVDPELPAKDVDAIGRRVADEFPASCPGQAVYLDGAGSVQPDRVTAESRPHKPSVRA